MPRRWTLSALRGLLPARARRRLGRCLASLNLFERAGLFLFFLGTPLERGLARAGIALLLLGLIPSWRPLLKFVRESPAARMGLLFSLFCLGEGLFHPDQWRAALRLSYLGGFPLVAFALGRQGAPLRWLLLALFGFLLGRLLHLGELLAAGPAFWQGRYELGFATAIVLGLYAATAVFGLLTLGSRRWPALLALLLSAEWLLLSKTRSAWLALLPLLLLRGLNLPKLTLPLLFLLLLHWPVLEARITTEASSYLALLHGELPEPLQAPGLEKSVAIRIWMALLGLELWRERPLFGFGPGATPRLIEETFPPDFPRFNDLHATPVELLVRLGALGLLLYSGMVAAVLWSGWRGFRAGRIPPRLFGFALGAAWIYLFMSLFDFRLLNDDWRNFWFITAALLTAWEVGKGEEQDRRGAQRGSGDL